ncbi:MAG: cell division protein FtsX [Bacteroidia bacterium]|nr:cell division protein FtsX [Bacteroidia bacterium]
MNEEKKLVRKTQRSSRLSTVVSISLVLFLLGTLGVLLLHAGKLQEYVKENIEIVLIIKPEADSTQVNDVLSRINGSPYVKSSKLVSKEEAAEALKKDLGEDFLSFLGYNPLYPSIDIRLKAEFAEENTIRSFIDSIHAHPSVSEVQYQPSLVESINRNLRTISWILLTFSALLILVSVTLINNTIRISLYARRLLIKSMLLVGATKGFILQPFLIRSIWNGLLGSFIAIVLLIGLMYFAFLKVPELSLIRDFRLMAIVAAGLLATGIFLSFICTWFAVNKYLRYRTDQLY